MNHTAQPKRDEKMLAGPSVKYILLVMERGDRHEKVRQSLSQAFPECVIRDVEDDQ